MKLDQFRELNLFQYFIFVVLGCCMYFTGGGAGWNSIGFISAPIFSFMLAWKYRIGFNIKGYLLFSLVLYSAFIVLAFFVSNDSAKIIVGLKYYFYFAPLFFVCSEVVKLDHAAFLRIFMSWRFVFYMQIPILLIQYQMFFLKTGNWDSLVGTFGGDPMNSGNSSGMAIFVLCYAALISSLFSKKIITFRKYFVDLLMVFLIAGLAEVKVVIFLIPLVVFLAFVEFTSAAVIRSVLLGGLLLLFGYLALDFYGSTFYSDMNLDVSEVIDFVLEEFLDPDYILLEFGDLGRVTALVVWWENNVNDLMALLFGNGVMSVKENPSIHFMSISSYFQYKLGGSALVNLLWDFGLVGTLAFVIVLCGFCVNALSESSKVKDPLLMAALKCSAISILVILFTLPYSNSLVDTPQIQLLLIFVVSVAVYKRHYSVLCKEG